MRIPLESSARWVLIGDSITDCGRRTCPENIGSGYPRLIRDWLLSAWPQQVPQIINTGISGNKVPDLQARWEEDVLAHTPSLVSIKIGINDVWHGLGGKNNGTALPDFVEGYERLISRLKEKQQDVTLVLCEPSVIWPPAPEEGNQVLQPYVEAVRTLASKHNALCVPLHTAFERAKALRPDVSWAPDGVHPSSSGHMLIARTWLATLGLL